MGHFLRGLKVEAVDDRRNLGLLRDPADSRYDYPSKTRRAVVVIGYVVLLFVLLVAVLAVEELVLSILVRAGVSDCGHGSLCTIMAAICELAGGVAFFAGVCWLVYVGADGRLPGALRRERVHLTRQRRANRLWVRNSR